MARIKTEIKLRGGARLKKLLREARKGGASSVKVGFFSTARYNDKKGTPVAAVAAWNEFGTKTIPERPFFRQAIANMEDGVADILEAGLDPQTMVVNKQLAGRVGAHAAGHVMESISSMDSPPNSPATVRRKGSSNPLINTGMMRASVGWRVDDGSTTYPEHRPEVKPPHVAPK